MNLKKILLEAVSKTDNDIMRKNGQRIIREIEIGPYTIFLSVGTRQNFYNIGIVSDGKSCVTPDSQKRIKCDNNFSDIKIFKTEVIPIIKEWFKNFKPILIGSYDNRKINFYYKFLSKFFNLSKIMETGLQPPYDENSYYFQILSEK